MRLTPIIILLAVLQLSARDSRGQKLTYSKDNTTISQIFKEIKRQTGYNVVWYEGKLNSHEPIDVNFYNTPLNKVMDNVLFGRAVTYQIIGKAIVVKAGSPSFRDKLIALFANTDVRGRVLDENNQPLVGAVVKVKGTKINAPTDKNGEFFLKGIENKAILMISFLGYETIEIKASESSNSIKLILSTDKLNEVEIVSTGYQNIPKERATGSFTLIDEKTLNRNVGTNILDRLEGLTSGLLLNRGLPNQPGSNNSKISIRGRSTIFANPEPTIVLDGFPYDGTIDQINPADVESISILKDAAAASIWGAKASNGVIVITTKKGKNNQKLAIQVSSTITIAGKPDLYYLPQISSTDYINMEEFLFSKGNYTSALNNKYLIVSSAVEIFNQRKLGQISKADSAERISALKSQDVRSDLKKYAYRNLFYQQYNVNFRGGDESHRYYMSGGYDKNLDNNVSNSYDRLTLNTNNTYSLFKNRIEITGGLNFASSSTYSTNPSYQPYSPYDKWVDEQGRSLPALVSGGLRAAYLDTAGKGKLLDWRYRPKDELRPNSTSKNIQYRMILGVTAKIIDGLNLTSNYQYLKEDRDLDRVNPLDSYYTRNIINQYSKIVNNNVVRGIPLGEINDKSRINSFSKIFRLQADFNKNISDEHLISAIAGYEFGDNRIKNSSQPIYGYDPSTQTDLNNTINPLADYAYYYESGLSQRFSTAPTFGEEINISQSYYSNVGYTFRGKYTLSGSARRDESNLFGVKTNQKGVPLWSAGLAWNIDKERFINNKWWPVLKLRATYGVNGNIDKKVSGYLTVLNNGSVNAWGDRYATIQNPPNPELRWEKVRTWNVGIDFSIINNKVSGSIDLYQKKAQDLISNSLIAMQSGVTQFRGNSANVKTKGVDVLLNSENNIGKFLLATQLLMNYNVDKVTSYKLKQGTNSQVVSNNPLNPLEGYPYYSIFSLPSAGLNSQGLPQGYLNGIVSKDYSAILGLSDISQIKYHGSASPKYFGSLINTVSYKNFGLSISLTYKLGYYFRRTNVYGGQVVTNYNFSDFENRWQKAGDELKTIIPAFQYPNNASGASFFSLSEDLVERADHIRFQDVKLSYQFSKIKTSKSIFKNAQAFLYAKNLGILWKKTNLKTDPDFGSAVIPLSLSCSFGVNFNL